MGRSCMCVCTGAWVFWLLPCGQLADGATSAEEEGKLAHCKQLKFRFLHSYQTGCLINSSSVYQQMAGLSEGAFLDTTVVSCTPGKDTLVWRGLYIQSSPSTGALAWVVSKMTTVQLAPGDLPWLLWFSRCPESVSFRKWLLWRADCTEWILLKPYSSPHSTSKISRSDHLSGIILMYGIIFKDTA